MRLDPGIGVLGPCRPLQQLARTVELAQVDQHQGKRIHHLRLMGRQVQGALGIRSGGARPSLFEQRPRQIVERDRIGGADRHHLDQTVARRGGPVGRQMQVGKRQAALRGRPERGRASPRALPDLRRLAGAPLGQGELAREHRRRSLLEGRLERAGCGFRPAG